MHPRHLQESKRLSAQPLEALVSSSPQFVKRRSVVGNGNSLSSAQQPSLQPKALIGQLVSQASTCCGKRDSPAGHFSFTCNGSANITSEKQSDQAVAATTFQFKVNGPWNKVPQPHHGSPMQQVQGLATIHDTVVVPIVHEGVQSVLASLPGEQNLIFSCP